MAVIYTLESALKLSCDDILKEINLIEGEDGQIARLEEERQYGSLYGNLSNVDYERIRNEIEDLNTDLSTLRNAYSQKKCATGGPSKPEPEILLAGTLDFGNVPTDKTAIKTFTITNTGTSDLIISSFSPLNSTIFTTINWPELPYVITPKNDIKLDVKYSPTSVERTTATISFTNNAKNSANSITIIGNGETPKDIGVASLLGRKATGSIRIFTLRNVREAYIEGKNNPDINSPFFDARPTKHNVTLVADIVQCYSEPNNPTTITKTLLEGVIIGKGVGSFWYEECDDFIGGLLPVYQYYYELTQVNNIRTWTKLQPLNITDNQNLPENTLENPNASSDFFRDLTYYSDRIKALADEFEAGTAFWGEFNKTNQNQPSCNKFNGANNQYITTVLTANLQGNSFVKIYDGRSDQKQVRSLTITNKKQPDLKSPIYGSPEKTLNYAYISKVGFGRLSCLSPRSGCYIVDQKPYTGDISLNGTDEVRQIGDYVTKLSKIGRPSLPEQIPSDPCYRGYKTKYISGFLWERKWVIQLNCLDGFHTEYEWRRDDDLFIERGKPFEVWEDVEFAGTEIGFSDVCNPIEVAKEQEPYVEVSDIKGCFQLHTFKIFHKYPDYKVLGIRDYIKGPEVLSTVDYSGLGPGIKLHSKIQRADCIDTPIKVYQPLSVGKDIIAGRDFIETKGLFNYTQSLFSYSTSSKQTIESKKYYYDIVDETRLVKGEPVSYLAVSYGNKQGSGSLYQGFEVNDSPTRAIYSQHILLALDSPETEFKFYDNGILTSNRKDIYILSFNRDSLIDRIDPGNFEINLKDFGSSNVMSFIDNSNDLLETQFSNDYVYTSFDIVSGSLVDGIHSSGTGSIKTNSNLTTYGKVYPSLGIIVFDAKKLDDELSFATVTGSNVNGDNAYKIFTAISGAAALGYEMKARSSTTKKSNYYYIRVNPNASNYTNNPTMIDLIDKKGIIINEYFKLRPVTYITTVGLYNDSNELLAVAKLSKPIMKTADKDILIKIRLNW